MEHVKAACLPDKLNYPMLEEYDFRCPFACHYMGALYPTRHSSNEGVHDLMMPLVYVNYPRVVVS